VTAAAKLLEKDFQRTVLELAELRRWLCYHTYDSRRSQAGFPDLVLVRRGRLIFAELKTDVGRVSDPQQEWLKALDSTAAEVHVWRPVDLTNGLILAALK
jgi:hypothetical protein